MEHFPQNPINVHNNLTKSDKTNSTSTLESKNHHIAEIFSRVFIRLNSYTWAVTFKMKRSFEASHMLLEAERSWCKSNHTITE